MLLWRGDLSNLHSTFHQKTAEIGAQPHITPDYNKAGGEKRKESTTVQPVMEVVGFVVIFWQDEVEIYADRTKNTQLIHGWLIFCKIKDVSFVS